jgi:mannose-6-phosphate isomerase-like protein (cupin superfamily)
MFNAMFRQLIIFLAAAATLTAAVRPPLPTACPLATPIALPSSAQSDTLTAGVFPPNPTILKGATRDLADLDIRLITLKPGESFTPTYDSNDHMIIVREGVINLALDPPTMKLAAGGIALFPAPWTRVISSAHHTKASFYLFSFKSRSTADFTSYKNDFISDWSQLVVKPTPKGESRAIFSQPTTWLTNINMHATTLNPGEISHPQHMHRAEEILLIRSGSVRMHIANGYIPAKGGDLVFLPSGVPHDLENGNTGRTEYFALQWEQ